MWLPKFLLLFIISFIIRESSSLKCGVENNAFVSRIFGGSRVDSKEELRFPWVLALKHRALDQFYCAGTLISNKHVLSAAHCFQPKGFVEILLPYEIICQFNKFNLSDSEEDFSESLVLKIVIHPDWSFKDIRYDADIAVLVLRDKIDTALPVCLPPHNYEEVRGIGVVLGWGKSENSAVYIHDQTPSEVEIPAINGTHCFTTFPKLAPAASNRVFCGGYENEEKAPCLGDSGGGFYLQDQQSKPWIVAGIVSMALTDEHFGCDINSYSLYTNVAMYVDWIEEFFKETEDQQSNNITLACVKSSFYVDKSDEYFPDPGPIYEADCSVDKESESGWDSKYVNAKFSGLDKDPEDIKNLRIDVKNFDHIPSGLGKMFPKLEFLRICPIINILNTSPKNHLRTLDQFNFYDMTNLKMLILSHNNIDFIDTDAFQDILQIELIDLQSCSLKSVPNGLFQNLGNLKRLNLDKNPMKQVSFNLFSDLVNLETLIFEIDFKFEDNHVKNLIVHLQNLTTLRFSGAEIDTLNRTLLEHKLNLTKLDLKRNFIVSIDEDTFVDVKKLESLSLSENLIQFLEPKTFHELKLLKVLELQKNFIAELHEDIFQENTLLKKINLSFNQLKFIQTDFTLLPKLNSLDLTNNECINNKYLNFLPILNGLNVPSVRDLQDIASENCVIPRNKTQI